MHDVILEVRDLHVDFAGDGRAVPAVRGVNLRFPESRCVGVVGESGSGKSVTMLALMGLLPTTATVRGAIIYRGNELRDHREVAALRGKHVAMVSQDSMNSLNPTIPAGRQVAEALRQHSGLGRRAANDRAAELLSLVGLPDPKSIARSYPHELSGGMRQRVMIAGALACEPAVLIADEATTGLDVTVQARILHLLDRLRDQLGLSVVFVSHDLGAVAQLCDEINVMYGGRVMESGPREQVLFSPRHPYTQGLLASLPRLETRVERLSPIALPNRRGLPRRGCPFEPRCPHRETRCADEAPPETERDDGAWRSACWLEIDAHG
jgi:oligopeptide transport system ATP-binding protein